MLKHETHLPSKFHVCRDGLTVGIVSQWLDVLLPSRNLRERFVGGRCCLRQQLSGFRQIGSNGCCRCSGSRIGRRGSAGTMRHVRQGTRRLAAGRTRKRWRGTIGCHLRIDVGSRPKYSIIQLKYYRRDRRDDDHEADESKLLHQRVIHGKRDRAKTKLYPKVRDNYLNLRLPVMGFPRLETQARPLFTCDSEQDDFRGVQTRQQSQWTVLAVFSWAVGLRAGELLWAWTGPARQMCPALWARVVFADLCRSGG